MCCTISNMFLLVQSAALTLLEYCQHVSLCPAFLSTWAFGPFVSHASAHTFGSQACQGNTQNLVWMYSVFCKSNKITSWNGHTVRLLRRGLFCRLWVQLRTVSQHSNSAPTATCCFVPVKQQTWIQCQHYPFRIFYWYMWLNIIIELEEGMAILLRMPWRSVLPLFNPLIACQECDTSWLQLNTYRIDKLSA